MFNNQNLVAQFTVELYDEIVRLSRIATNSSETKDLTAEDKNQICGKLTEAFKYSLHRLNFESSGNDVCAVFNLMLKSFNPSFNEIQLKDIPDSQSDKEVLPCTQFLSEEVFSWASYTHRLKHNRHPVWHDNLSRYLLMAAPELLILTFIMALLVPTHVWLILAIVAVSLFATMALFYVMQQLWDDVMRMIHQEGFFRGMSHLMVLFASFAATAILAVKGASMPITLLAFALNLAHPIGFTIAGIVACALILSASIGKFFQLGQTSLLSQLNKDAIDPDEPIRMELSKDDENRLSQDGKSALAVHTAMILERRKACHTQKLGFFDRLSTNEVSTIRQLKQGKLPAYQDSVLTMSLTAAPGA